MHWEHSEDDFSHLLHVPTEKKHLIGFIYLFIYFIYLLTKNQQRSSRQLQDGIDKSYDINKISPK